MPNHGICDDAARAHGALWLAMDRGALVRLSGKRRARSGGADDSIPNGLTEGGDGTCCWPIAAEMFTA